MRAAASVASMLAALCLAACGGPSADLPERVKDGRALAEVRRLVDGKRACAGFMYGNWPARAADYMLQSDSVKTLVSADIIIVRPDGTYDGLPALRLIPTAQGAKYFRITPLPKVVRTPLNAAEPDLCYGKLQVAGIHLVRDELRSNYSLEFAVRVVDFAPWTLRPDIRRAFPFLTRMEGKTFVSDVFVFRNHYFGPLELTHDPEADPLIDNPRPGFWSCSFKAHNRNPQCE